MTPEDLASIQADADMLDFLAKWTQPVANWANAFETFRRVITEGDAGDAESHLPPAPVLTPPAAVMPGIFQRLASIVTRVRAAANFTSETSAVLGIEPTRYRVRATHLEHGASPRITASTWPGNTIIVKFVRGASAGISIQMRLDNDEEWQAVDKFFRSPAEFTVPADPDGLPRRVHLRARFLDGNDIVGDWSPIVTVVTVG